MSVAAYPEYRESGVEWIGSVPVGWSVFALKYLVSMTSGNQITSEQIEEAGEFPVFGGNGLRGFTTSFTHDGRFALIGRQGALCGNINYAQGKFWASEHAVVVTPRMPCEVFWLGEMLRSMNLGQYSVTAAQPGLSVEAIGNLRIPVPSQSEQSAIAAFLDRETGNIDALVAEQERLMALLKEKRQTVISQAVTKGLDPNVPMKDSGVEWLGRVPAHWRLMPIRAIYRLVKRQDKANLEVLSVYRDYGVIQKNSRSDNINKTPEDLSLYQTVNQNDIVVNKMKSWQGSLGVSCISGITSPDYAVFEPTQKVIPGYLNWLLRCSLLPDIYRTISNGIRPDQWRLEPDRFREIRIPYPPLSEQLEIDQALKRKIENFDTLATEAARAIDLLKERRAALITAAVTGKIDVRGLVDLEAKAA